MNISKDLIITDLHCEDCANFEVCQYYTCDKTKSKDHICGNFSLYIESLRKEISDLPYDYNTGFRKGFAKGVMASIGTIEEKYKDELRWNENEDT